MKLLEMKNRLALETALFLFRNGIQAVFIGGTALNTFYLDYRYSEDLDLAYTRKNIRPEIEDLLIRSGYQVERTSLEHRDVIIREGISIKLDIVEFEPKYNGTENRVLDGVSVSIPALEEFFVEKTISFFTREEWTGMGRDAYDLFSMEKQYHLTRHLIPSARPVIARNVASPDLNLQGFESRQTQIQEMMEPYLRKPVKGNEVLAFLKKLRRLLRG